MKERSEIIFILDCFIPSDVPIKCVRFFFFHLAHLQIVSIKIMVHVCGMLFVQNVFILHTQDVEFLQKHVLILQ